MMGSQGKLFAKQLVEISDEVLGTIAGQLGYDGAGLDTTAMSGWIAEGNCSMTVMEVAGNRMATLAGIDEECILLSLTPEGETAWMVGDGGQVRYTVADLLEMWRHSKASGKGGDDFPLSPVVRSFLEEPRAVVPDIREIGRILPAKLAMVPPGDSRGADLFSWAAHVQGTGRAQLIMPGFEREGTVAPVLPLVLYDLGGSEEMESKKSSAAPLALRLFVESILAVQLGDRTGDGLVAMNVPLRVLLSWLYSSGRRPRPAEYWPRLMRAAEVLDSREARVPWLDRKTGKGGYRRIVSIGGIPRGPNSLDDDVRIIVDLPPGSDTGPQVSDRLRHYGSRSAVAYRMLLHFAYRWHHPGRTLMPAKGGKRSGNRWLRVYDPSRYDFMTDDELVQMAYPLSTQRNKRYLLQAARRWLDVLVADGEVQVVDGKFLPPAPVAA